MINKSWIWSFFKFWNSFFVLSNSLQEKVYVNPGCLKCILGMNLSPANKNLLIILFIIIYFNKSCVFKLSSLSIIIVNIPINRTGFWNFKYNFINNGLSNGTLLIIPNNRFACYTSINLDFLLSNTVHFDESVIFPFFVFATLGFLPTSNKIILFYQYVKLLINYSVSNFSKPQLIKIHFNVCHR